MNDDFEGGEFIFTEMDAKTVTVSKPIQATLCSISSSQSCCFPRTHGLWDFKYLSLRIQEVHRGPANVCIMNFRDGLISKIFQSILQMGSLKSRYMQDLLMIPYLVSVRLGTRT